MQKTGLRRGLTTAQLKWIALVLMVLDHIHYFFEFTGAVPLLFSQLGRLSAGLFLFCLIEGFIHTHDRRRYFLRIYLVSVGMGAVQFCCILFDFCRRPDGFYPMNQMLATFAVLLPMLRGVDWLRQKRWLRGLAALVLPFAWPFFMLMVIYPMFPQAEGWLTLLGFTVLPSQSNFLFARSDRIGGGELYRTLKKNGILVRWFDSDRIRDYVRITVGSMEQMEALIDALTALLEAL